MSLLHPLSVRRVGDLKPGELARVRLFSGLALVIAAQDERGQPKLVSLDRGPPNRQELHPPVFVSPGVARADDALVIGADYVLVPGDLATAKHARDDGADANGALMLTPGGVYLRVHGMQDGFDTALLLDWAGGKLLTWEPDQERAFLVPSWSLVRRPEHPAAPLDVLFSFEGAR